MRSHRSRAVVILMAAAWTFYVWGTRILNIWENPANTFAFKAVHSVIAAISVAFGLALVAIGARMLREARAARRRDEPATPARTG